MVVHVRSPPPSRLTRRKGDRIDASSPAVGIRERESGDSNTRNGTNYPLPRPPVPPAGNQWPENSLAKGTIQFVHELANWRRELAFEPTLRDGWSFNMYLVINKWVIAVKVSNFSGQYLRKHWTLDIGVLGYIVIVWPKKHSPEGRSFPPGTPSICSRDYYVSFSRIAG